MDVYIVSRHLMESSINDRMIARVKSLNIENILDLILTYN